MGVIDRNLYDRITQYYEESNRRVAREFFNRDELFFEPYTDRYLTQFSIKDFPPEELLDIMTFITNRLLTEESTPDIMSERRSLREKIALLSPRLRKRLTIKPRIE